jgi:predicted MFS family arabinose efflux permease
VRILIATKALRTFAYAFVSIVLPIFLVQSGYSAAFVGLVLTITILASVLFNVLVTLYLGRVGERAFLVSLALVMAISGALFAWSPNAAVVVAAALLGAISVTGTETGPFQSIEQSIISNDVEARQRTSKLALYNFAGYTATAVGSLFSGLPDRLSSVGVDMRVVLYAYSAVALAIALLYLLMPDTRVKGKERVGGWSSLAPETRRTVVKLSALFSVDAFGGGFVLQSLLTLWFYKRWGLDLESLSLLFFASGIITAVSIFLAPVVARRIGLLKTMVFTHLASSVFLVCIPLAPSMYGAVALLFCRQSISQMDVPTRQSYTMAIVRPEDRASVAALTNIPRTVAQGLSPSLSSYLIGVAQWGLPFFIGGGVKMAYDVAIYITFKDVKPPEEG